MANNKEELLSLWQKIFNQVYEISAYAQLFACSYLCISSNHLDKETAERNLKILNTYKNFFSTFEHGISYAVVLSITKLFEDKKELSLLYLVSEAAKFKINHSKDAYATLKETHLETLKALKIARNNFFAHRNKEFNKFDLPSRDKIFALLKDIACFLNAIGREFKNSELKNTHVYAFEEGFAEGITRDFQLVLDNLYRGERARITEIEVKYSEKL